MSKGISRRMSTPRKLMLSLLGVLFTFMCVSNLLLSYSINSLNRETVRSLEIQYANALENLQINISRVYDMAVNLLADQDLNSLTRFSGRLGDITRTSAIARVQDKITIIKNSNPLLSNVSVFIPQYSISINAYGSAQGSLVRHSEEEVAQKSALVGSWTRMMECADDRLIMPIISRNPQSGTPYYAIIMELSADAIMKSLGEAPLRGDAISLLDVNGGEFSLATTADSGIVSFIRAQGVDFQTRSLSFEGREYLLMMKRDAQLNLAWYTLISSSALLSPIRTLSYIAILLVALVVMCAALYVYMDYTMVDRPLRALVDAFHSLEEGDLDVQLTMSGSNEFGKLFARFNGMTAHLKSLIDVTYKQRMLIQNAELKQLQQQTNPHFLYNSYFLLHRLVKKGDHEQAAWLSHELGQYLKYITRSGRDFVPFKEEYEQALIYTQIQAKRFAGRIEVSYPQLPEGCEGLLMPRLVIQPLIENSFLHGLENKECDGVLAVAIRAEKDEVVIVVEDNGDDLTDDALTSLAKHLVEPPEGEITALMNISRRLELLYGASGLLSVSRSDLGGLRTDLRLPKRGDGYETVGGG